MKVVGTSGKRERHGPRISRLNLVLFPFDGEVLPTCVLLTHKNCKSQPTCVEHSFSIFFFVLS